MRSMVEGYNRQRSTRRSAGTPLRQACGLPPLPGEDIQPANAFSIT